MTITLNGAHQCKNAAVAVMTLEVLRQYYALNVEDDDADAGTSRLRMARAVGDGVEQPAHFIDGAHNPEGAETLAAALQSIPISMNSFIL